MTGVKTGGMEKTIEDVVVEQATKCRVYVAEATKLARDALLRLGLTEDAHRVLEKAIARATVAAYDDSMERIGFVAKGMTNAGAEAAWMTRIDGLLMGLKCTRDEEAKKL